VVSALGVAPDEHGVFQIAWEESMTGMRRILVLCIAPAVFLAAAAPARAELPLAEMRATIDAGADYLISLQQPDGSWTFNSDAGRYDVGMTSLASLALAHTRLGKATAPVQKALAYITQTKPEAKTYTVGLVEMLLYESGASQYNRLIGQYAWMTVMGQVREGVGEGGWGYALPEWSDQAAMAKEPPHVGGYADHSNSQFGVLALVYAQRAGFQVPKMCWLRTKRFYENTQEDDGGWGYGMAKSGGSSATMTPASTVSLFLADEALNTMKHDQCKMVPENPAVERGMKWVGQRMGGSPYAWYAVERLGILSGRGEFGGNDWLEKGAKALAKGGAVGGKQEDTAFVVLFLARALEPIIINKLKRPGDWNDDPYDIKHLTEYISGKFQYLKQWRIVTMDAPVDFLLKVPILFISGHKALTFTDEEKTKLKEYVNRGGTILGMDCCSKKPFDKSFRALAAELWPESKMEVLPKTHSIYSNPRPLTEKPTLEGVNLGQGQGRLGVIYVPSDLCCRWHVGGAGANPVFDVGANIYFYVSTTGVKMGGVREGQREDTTGGDKNPATPVPEPAAPQPAPVVPAPVPPEPANPPPANPDTPAPPAANLEPPKPDAPADEPPKAEIPPAPGG
jgi:hypothetical protein